MLSFPEERTDRYQQISGNTSQLSPWTESQSKDRCRTDLATSPANVGVFLEHFVKLLKSDQSPIFESRFNRSEVLPYLIDTGTSRLGSYIQQDTNLGPACELFIVVSLEAR